MKCTLSLLLILILSPVNVFANADGSFFLSISANINSDDDDINVNIRNPSDTQNFSFQDTAFLELGYQFEITPTIVTDVSIVSRSSTVGEPVEGIADFIDEFFDCFFGLFCDDDNDSLEFEGATFNPLGLHIVPAYQTDDLQLGIGLSFYGSQDIEVGYADSGMEKIRFKRATGLVFKSAYYLTDWLALTLSYENIEFSAKDSARGVNNSIIDDRSGDNVALGFRFTFD